MSRDLRCLPGVNPDYLRQRFGKSPGNEIASGKFLSDESSARLAANCFGWFASQPEQLPIPSDCAVRGPAIRVEVEESLRFPWRGGLHPWLDAVIETDDTIIAVESKRCEPFRVGAKKSAFSPAYWRDVWGVEMAGWQNVRDALHEGRLQFSHLDAAQLVKHSLGLATQAARAGKQGKLLYVFAEPAMVSGRMVSDEARRLHRAEIAEMISWVRGDKVPLYAVSYREWIDSWTRFAAAHGAKLVEVFAL